MTGYISSQNLVTKVETHVDHAVVGDLLVEFEYSGYQNMNGVQVPTRIVHRQAGLQTFDATIESATPNPPTLAELLAPPPAGGAPAPAAAQPPPAAPPVERIGDGVFKIGGNYTSLAVDMGDHVLVVESGQSDARGTAVMAAARQAIPTSRFGSSSIRIRTSIMLADWAPRSRKAHHPDASQQRAGSRAASGRQPIASR